MLNSLRTGPMKFDDMMKNKLIPSPTVLNDVQKRYVMLITQKKQHDVPLTKEEQEFISLYE